MKCDIILPTMRKIPLKSAALIRALPLIIALVHLFHGIAWANPQTIGFPPGLYSIVIDVIVDTLVITIFLARRKILRQFKIGLLCIYLAIVVVSGALSDAASIVVARLFSKAYDFVMGQFLWGIYFGHSALAFLILTLVYVVFAGTLLYVTNVFWAQRFLKIDPQLCRGIGIRMAIFTNPILGVIFASKSIAYFISHFQSFLSKSGL